VSAAGVEGAFMKGWSSRSDAITYSFEALQFTVKTTATSSNSTRGFRVGERKSEWRVVSHLLPIRSDIAL
jgi:hypothetical protein